MTSASPVDATTADRPGASIARASVAVAAVAGAVVDLRRSWAATIPGSPVCRFGLLETDDFVAELVDRLDQARHRVALQLMTFDGDHAGRRVARALRAAVTRGVAVRLLVDSFAFRFVSDTPVGHPSVAAEHRVTLAMYDGLRAAGVELRFTHPNGPFNLFALARNHKKLYIIDDTVYLGGINVSDHNFAWHDFMVRVDDPGVLRAAVADFDATFAGLRLDRGVPAGSPEGTGWADGRDDPVPVGSAGGAIVTNQVLARTFDDLVVGARDRLVVASPYALDRRLVRLVAASPARHKMVVLAPDNNFRCLQWIAPDLMARLDRAGVELRHFGRFSHAKFVLADDVLLVGSANFGRHSLTCNQEIGLLIRDPAFGARFESVFLAGLQPAPVPRGALRRLWAMVAASVIDSYLIVYARAIAPMVPPLAPPPRPARPGDGRRRSPSRR